MKIGIFLAYAPGIKMSNQGLGRQLLQFTAGFHNHSGEAIAILCPSWLRDDVHKLLSQGAVSNHAYRIICPPGGIPISFRIQRLLSAHLERLRSRRTISRAYLKLKELLYTSIYAQVRKLAVYLLSTRSIVGFSLTFLTSLILAIAIAPVALPLVVVGASLYGLARWIRRMMRRVSARTSSIPIVSQLNAFLLDARKANQISFVQRAYNGVYRRETSWMVNFANRDGTIDFWFSPTVFWPEFNAINKPSALCFPDMVLSEFPVSFAVDHPHTLAVFGRCEKTIEGGRHFITYSDVTAEEGLERRFGVNKGQISVIPHAAMDLSHHISIEGTLDPGQARRRFAVNLLEGHRNVHWQTHRYLSNFSFQDTKYLFYPSQIRPNKNIVNLIRGYEISLRRKHQYAKLILTGDVSTNTEISNFLRARRLQYDIIFFNDVPEQILAALYHLAELVINPTLYEGGFPFTFTEGLSVGTPSIMSDIPQVRQAIPNELAEEMLFDPYSPETIANAIVHGLTHRARLVDLQMPLYRKMRKRSWSDVASDHVATFSKIRDGIVSA